MTNYSEIMKRWVNSRFPQYAIAGDPVNGTYGLIYFLEAKEEHVYPKSWAVKTVNPDRLQDTSDVDELENFERELRLWLRVPFHRNVLPATGIEMVPAPTGLNSRVVRLPLARMPRYDCSLREWISDQNTDIDTANRLIAITMLCNGLQWLYINGIEGHGDLKPENVLASDLRSSCDLPQNGIPCLRYPWLISVADLGWADAWKDLGLSDKAWRPYLAPERYDGEFTPVASDIFAVGVIIAELLTSKHPVGVPVPKLKNWSRDKLNRWANSGPRALDGITNSSLHDLIHRCLSPNPQNRPTPQDIIDTVADVLAREHQLDHIKFLLEHYNKEARPDIYHEMWANEESAMTSRSSLESSAIFARSRLEQLLPPRTPQEFADWLEIAQYAARLTSRLNSSRGYVYLTHLANATISCIQTILNNADRTSLLHTGAYLVKVKYPDFKTLRPFDGIAMIVRNCRIILLEALKDEQVTEVLNNMNSFLKAVNHFCIAEDYRNNREDLDEAQRQLDTAINLIPDEADLWNYKGIWLEFGILMATESGEDAISMKAIQKTCYQRACDLDPSWDEPQKELSKLLDNE